MNLVPLPMFIIAAVLFVILVFAVIPSADAQLGQCGGKTVMKMRPGETFPFFWCVLTTSTTPVDVIFQKAGDGSQWFGPLPPQTTLEPKPIDQPTGFGPKFRLSVNVTIPDDFACSTTKHPRIAATLVSPDGSPFLIRMAKTITVIVNATQEAPLFLVKVAPGTNPQSIIDQYGLNGEVFKTMNAFSMQAITPYSSLLYTDSRILSLQEERIFTTQQQILPTGVDRIKAQTVTKIVSPTMDVAVIDTGISMTNTDLNVVGGKNFLDSCFPDDWDDDHGHGTHVAGIIGAIDNNEGVIGVAPGVKLWAYKVLDARGSGTETNIIRAIEDIILRGDIEIINMSLGGFGFSQTACGGNDLFHNVICNARNAGIKVVVAAGNSNIDARNFIPAGYEEAITVSAMCDFDGTHGGLLNMPTRLDDSRATFSNFGLRIDIAAPGCNIVSSAPNNELITMSGTSMAAPHVAGALVFGEKLHNIGIPQDHQFGFTGDNSDDFRERFLYLGDATVPVHHNVTVSDSIGLSDKATVTVVTPPTPEPEPPIPEPPTDIESRIAELEARIEHLEKILKAAGIILTL